MFRPHLFKRAFALRPLQQSANYIVPSKQSRTINVFEPLRAQSKTSVLDHFKSTQKKRLDPTSWRENLISPSSPDRIRTGDVLRVMYTSRSIPPFVGQVIAVSKKGLDASITLRNNISKIGVEVKVKVYSPLIQRVDVVRRPHQYKKRNRQYYIRETRLDVGDLEASLRRRS
ncbi:CYFA0S05e00320g1_1 [Cyberlindnera fabianii]|uniref:CYFA0S05e00320g1_1 n=1 Tax=Cyberlindnera fabianii TaxID=36022 RepID=A0A061AS43_CYBFA|nr:hypothetical protein BON22_2255 [Cyberlindnera fabianii]CDR40396.1 CYFA0S05e00320g1_1 [Cyberlindnera fabianii]